MRFLLCVLRNQSGAAGRALPEAAVELLWSWWHPFASPRATKSLSEVTRKEGDLTPLPAEGFEGCLKFLSSHRGMSVCPPVPWLL